MGRHKTTAAKELIGVRLEPSTIDELDGLCERFSSEWFRASRSDVVRALLMYALQEMKDNRDEVMTKMGLAPSAKRGRPRSKKST